MNPWIARSLAGLFASVVVSLLIMLILLLPRNLPGIPEHPHFDRAAPDGIFRTYYWIGTLKEEWTLAGGEANGPMIQHYPNGSVMREIPYVSSSPDGVIREYYELSAGGVRHSRRLGPRPSAASGTVVGERGDLRAEWTYADGRRDGPYRIFWESGDLKEEGSYAGGRKMGLVRKYPKTR